MEIIKQNILDCLQTNNFNYNSLRELANLIAEKLSFDSNKVFECLKLLIKEGDVYEYDKNSFASIHSLGMVKGRLIGNPKGFAFVESEDSNEDIFIPSKFINSAMNNDIVLVELIKDSPDAEKNDEGKVVKILSRETDQIVGTYQKFKNFGWVVPDDAKYNRDIFIPGGKDLKAKDGDKVVVTITNYGGDKKPEGYVNEVIGDKDAPGNDVLSLMRQHKIYEEFPKKVLEYVKKVPQQVTQNAKQNRRDLTNLITFTIDGEDAKDLDDAVSLEMDGDIYKLGVHIADVGQYVTRGGVLDEEAYKRGTSVYFCDRVVPMLPKELSNGICSLNEGVERLTLSVFMDIDSKGNVIKHDICESFIKSNHRMTYTSVYKILQGDEQESSKYSDIKQTILKMGELSQLLQSLRDKRGAIDFDFPETYLVIDERGKLVDVKAREHNSAHKLIETFMVIANETIAKHFYDLKLPFVYRVHEKPDVDKMTTFFAFLNSFGIHYDCDLRDIKPMDMQKILRSIDDKNYKDVISSVMLRSLKKARYLPECLGHFGLASEFYCHFTSPIRRYPDLTIHRIIKQYLHGTLNGNVKKELFEFVQKSSVQSSEREKLAEEMERAVDDMKKAEYMKNFIGSHFVGVISGLNQRGIFVMLDNTCEGIVNLENLPSDTYEYEETTYCLVGNNNRFRLGDKVEIEVVDTNVRERKVYFKYISKA